MSTKEVDDYLAALSEPKRSTLRRLRQTILELIPEAEEGLSYQVPVFRIGGKAVAGFSAAKSHLSYLPHSGRVLAAIAADLDGYETSKGALKFAVERPLPKAVVRKLIAARRAELARKP